MKKDPSQEFITLICSLYNDHYDDREEDSSIGGEDWVPGVKANHQSLAAFQKELRDNHNISLSTSKLRKILITGGVWTTERSREVAELFGELGSIGAVAEALDVTESLVTMYLPYGRIVYGLEDKTGNARRIERYRARKEAAEWKVALWMKVVDHEGEEFRTSGRGITFTYNISEPGSGGGRHYEGENIEGYGNELWITRSGEVKRKSISRSTVELAYSNALKVEEEEGCVSGPRKLGVPGARSYLYAMFLAFGYIKRGGTEPPLEIIISSPDQQ